MSNEDRKPSKVGEDARSGQAHEDAARESARKFSWLRQLRRAFRLSKGRPRGGASKRP